jgi:hypothetical protein
MFMKLIFAAYNLEEQGSIDGGELSVLFAIFSKQKCAEVEKKEPE